MKTRKKAALVVAAGACVLAGAAAGISQSAADSSSKRGHPAHSAGAGALGFGHGGRPGPGGEVHATEVVLNKAGTAYITVTRDNGTITEVDMSGGKITLKEGTSSVTYATPTITIPAGATVILDGAKSSLEKLKAGDRVSISSSSEGTIVFATDSSFKPEGRPMGGPPPGAPQGVPQAPGGTY